MKLTNVRPVGRYLNTITGQKYNVKIGQKFGRSTDYYFYLQSGIRMYINDADFHNNHTKIKN